MLSRWLGIGLPVMLFLLTASQADAGIRSHHCSGAGCAACCEPQIQYVQKVVMQRQMCPETRQVVCTEYRQELREKKYVVYQCVQEKKAVNWVETVMEHQTRTKMVNYTVCRQVFRPVTEEYQVCIPTWTDKPMQYTVHAPVYTDREVKYTVNVAHQEMRQGVRRVCRSVPHQVNRQVVRDCGRWTTQNYTVQCGCDCNGCPLYRTCCRKVWVPNLVTEDIACTVYRPEYVDVPYNYCVTVCRPEVRSCMVRECSYRPEIRNCTVRVCGYRYERRQRTYNVCEYKPEVHQKEVQYTVCVPKQIPRSGFVMCPKQVAVEKTCQISVCVPYQVQKQIVVNVCKMVPKTIMVPVCCGPCCN